jgi:hypothetical protein
VSDTESGYSLLVLYSLVSALGRLPVELTYFRSCGGDVLVPVIHDDGGRIAVELSVELRQFSSLSLIMCFVLSHHQWLCSQDVPARPDDLGVTSFYSTFNVFQEHI